MRLSGSANRHFLDKGVQGLGLNGFICILLFIVTKVIHVFEVQK